MRFWNRLRDRLQRKRLTAELDEELRFHQQMLESEMAAKYADPAEARTAAQRRLGNRTVLGEDVRRLWSFSTLEELLRDCRYGLRALARTPAFTVVALLTLGLGIGANTAIFSVVYGVLYSPFPYREPGRLVLLNESMKDLPQIAVSYPNFLDWRERTRSFEGIALFSPFQSWTLTGLGDAERVRGGLATASFFDVLGVHPAIGRGFRPEDDRPGAERVALVSDRLWRTRLAGDSAHRDKTITLDGYSYAVVGVLPRQLGLAEAQVWIPMGLLADDPSFTMRTNHPATIGLARLKPGVTLEQARADLSAVAAGLREEYPTDNAGIGATASWLTEAVLGNVRPALLMLAGAVGFVLLIVCANVANLLLGRAASRQREIALRGALGARRGRLVRQLLAESLVLGLAGGVIGVALAWAGVHTLQALQPGNLPRLDRIRMDATVLWFAFAVSIVTGLVFGLVPALHAAAKEPLAALRDGGRTSSPGRRGLRLRSALMVAEVAMALVLLVGAGLLVRSFTRLARVELGFDPKHVLTAQIQLPDRNYGEPAARLVYFAELVSRIQGLPGVIDAALSSDLPSNSSWQMGITIEGRPVEPGSEPLVHAVLVTPTWFRTMGITAISGRGIEPSDLTDGVPVALISKAGARRFFGDESPIGHRYKAGNATATGPWITIVGVVGEVANAGFNQIPLGTVYMPVTQSQASSLWIAVRTSGKPDAIAPQVRAVVSAMDPGVPLSSVATMERVMSDIFASPRFAMLMLLIFAAIALVLAAVGIYGVIAYSVSQRAHEIGVRIALGARRREVVAMVVRQVFVLAGAGIALGTAGALATGRVMRKLLFQVTPTDLPTFAAVAALLAAVALIAAALPAWRASRLDPVSALREE